MKNLLERVKQNDFTLGVIGIGRVGLPLALVFANSGIRVIGIDKNKDYIEKIKRGEKPFHEVGIEDYLKNENFTPTTDIEYGIKNSDILIIAVGTPITEHMRPDYSQLRSVLEEIVKFGIKGKLIIMRSTVSPGTLENFVKPFIEKNTGLKAGKDFWLSVCPERIVEGKAIEELKILPEIIGGFDDESINITAELFKKINPNKKILITTPKAAELAKLFTNVYRYVNFSLANEFGLIAEEYGEDAYEIIKILNEDYPRGGVPIPGLTGGPCLSKDGYYLISNIAFPDFILMAWRLNESIPQHIVNRIKKHLNNKGKSLYNCKVALLGIAFKAGIDDTRYSPALRLFEILKNENAEVKVHDPYVEGTEDIEDVVENADVIILAMNHPEFKDIHKLIAKLKKHKEGCIFVDCWGFINGEEAKSLGFEYIRFGSAKY
ncbi:MAG: nucleotide sugar dehydrogenase [Candidatus Aenigmatarchaeota archaeon]